MAASKNSVVVVGSCMIDFVSYAPRLPKPGETIHGHKFANNFGGKGANQCVAAAKLGADAVLVARVGDDLWGDKYIDNLKSLAVNTAYVWKTANSPSGIAQINVSDNGENQIVIVPGANLSLSRTDIESKCRDLISQAKVVVCQLETSVDVAISSMELCTGVSILNGAPSMKVFPEKLLSMPSIFCVNENEAADFSGHKIQNLGDAKEAVKKLIAKGCNSVILTVGENGALYAAKGDAEVIHVTSPQVKCVDSTGAGDSFIGALAALIAQEKYSMKVCIQISCMIAAHSVTKEGTQISFPTVDILEKLLKTIETV